MENKLTLEEENILIDILNQNINNNYNSNKNDLIIENQKLYFLIKKILFTEQQEHYNLIKNIILKNNSNDNSINILYKNYNIDIIMFYFTNTDGPDYCLLTYEVYINSIKDFIKTFNLEIGNFLKIFFSSLEDLKCTLDVREKNYNRIKKDYDYFMSCADISLEFM